MNLARRRGVPKGLQREVKKLMTDYEWELGVEISSSISLPQFILFDSLEKN